MEASIIKPYTANQPLLLGGQIYMWNRYHEAKTLIHMVEAQYTLTGHQARIEVVGAGNTPIRVICPLSNRRLKPLNQTYLATPERTFTRIHKLIQSTYGKLANSQVAIDIMDTFNSYCDSDLATLNSSITDLIYAYLFHGESDYRTIKSIDLVPVRPYDASAWVAKLGSEINCNLYLGGKVAADAYLKRDVFAKQGIEVKTQNYKMPRYRITQQSKFYNENAMVSIIDPLIRLGVGATRDLIATNVDSTYE
jgi:hypothetical protein